MNHHRRIINISLIIIILLIGGVTVNKWLSLHSVLMTDNKNDVHDANSGDLVITGKVDTVYVVASADIAGSRDSMQTTPDENKPQEYKRAPGDVAAVTEFRETEIRRMTGSHPFAKEAAKVMSGKLEVEDSLRRRNILNYCEHFRTAYTTKDIDFLRQVFSENALIIVGHTVKTGSKVDVAAAGNEKVRLTVQPKQIYLERLARVFASNKKVDVEFSDFRIMRHPTLPDIYGVELHQKYSSDRYSDDGRLFLLWDFRNPSMPQIHVRTWQPATSIREEDDEIGIKDFYIE